MCFVGTVVVKTVRPVLGLRFRSSLELFGWVPVHKKCAPVRGRNSLDAEMGCGMLMENPGQWVDKVCNKQDCGSMSLSLSRTLCTFRWHALHAGGPLPSCPTPACGLSVACGSECAGFCGTWSSWECGSCHSSVKDIASTVTNWFK